MVDDTLVTQLIFKYYSMVTEIKVEAAGDTYISINKLMRHYFAYAISFKTLIPRLY